MNYEQFYLMVIGRRSMIDEWENVDPNQKKEWTGIGQLI